MQQGAAADEGIIVTGNCCRADNGAPLLLQAHSCFYSLEDDSSTATRSKQSLRRCGQSQMSWSIPVVQLMPARTIYELPGCASWRP